MAEEILVNVVVTERLNRYDVFEVCRFVVCGYFLAAIGCCCDGECVIWACVTGIVY